jgi:hypothetical protein
MVGHSCEKELKFSAHVTQNTDDSYFYIFDSEDDDDHYKFYHIINIWPDGIIDAKQVTTSKPFQLSTTLDLARVGVKENTGEPPRLYQFRESEITGKAITSGLYIMSIPYDVAQENY